MYVQRPSRPIARPRHPWRPARRPLPTLRHGPAFDHTKHTFSPTFSRASGDRPDLAGRVIGIDDAYARAVKGGGGQTPNLNEVLSADDVVPIVNKLYILLHAHP